MENKDLVELIGILRTNGVTHYADDRVTLTLLPQVQSQTRRQLPLWREDEVEERTQEFREQTARANWAAYWEAICFSSGSPVPDFPGVDEAEKRLAQ
jgi:hypothetical protein